MKELELSPYKIQVTQPLNEDHTQRRSEFAQLMLEKLQTGEIDVKKIWFSYEAYFTLDGHLNKHNYRYWGRERLEITVVRSLHPKKIFVWCAISSHGPYFHRWNSKRGELQKVPGRGVHPFSSWS
ncbi:t-complex protein 1 subunit delta [Nephila pilipes]|uniref:T-complex protein 1 subunit delta n=1 Tax=Nephila pilipes TaxID=299642 RepID=A0A8X6UG73_NEPPI|nr:t-complex protein 1 subunit delta [Nephila pilipes]